MKRILDSINSPEDLRKLNKRQLIRLARELRVYLVKTVSETGGHLASNLGVVELTIALHYCFNTPKDKIVWDVGHQSYVHKILTGRKNEFKTLRKLDGLADSQNRMKVLMTHLVRDTVQPPYLRRWEWLVPEILRAEKRK